MERKVGLKRKKGWITTWNPGKPKPPMMRRTRLRVAGKSETAEIKQEIQDVAREIVIARDGGCILRDVHDYLYGQPPCGGYRNDGELILQADHLITRGNAATYADTRLIVCVCKAHHGWKSVGNNLRKKQYDELVKRILPKERVALWERCEADSWRPTPMGAFDWKLQLLALKKEVKKYQRES